MKIYRSFIISLWNMADLFDNTGDRSVATNTGVLIPLRQGRSFRLRRATGSLCGKAYQDRFPTFLSASATANAATALVKS